MCAFLLGHCVSSQHMLEEASVLTSRLLLHCQIAAVVPQSLQDLPSYILFSRHAGCTGNLIVALIYIYCDYSFVCLLEKGFYCVGLSILELSL